MKAGFKIGPAFFMHFSNRIPYFKHIPPLNVRWTI